MSLNSIKKLQEIFSKFPTIGTRTASRFVFYILKLPKERIDELVSTIYELKDKVKFCNFCFNPHESQANLCLICQSTSRNRQLLCIVEKEADLISIENSRRYNGLYFILGEASSLRKNNVDKIRIGELAERIKNPEKYGLNNTDFKEIIVATNPTPEGELTSLLLRKTLKELSPTPLFKITNLAKGLPFGGELEYADDETLGSAFEGRK